MDKIRKCSFKGCDNLRMKKPGNTTLFFKFCMEHQIKANLTKLRAERAEDTEGLKKMRQSKRKTPRERFYASTAWRWFSKYVLLYYADENLEVRCATNPLLKYRVNDKRICVGHYIKVFDSNTSNYATAFDFRDVLPQSVQENIYKGGNMEEMAKAIDRVHGPGTAKELEIKSREQFKLDKYEFDKVTEEYRAKFKELLKQREIDNPWK